MPTTLTPLMTLEEFLELPDRTDGSKLELIRGQVVVYQPTKARKGIVCATIAYRLGDVIDRNDGWLTTNNAGVILERDPDTIVGPDVGFWKIKRVPEMPEDYFEVPPDLAVEVISPSDRHTDIRSKIKLYVDNGVPLVWLVDPDLQIVTVFSGKLKGVEHDSSDRLDGGKVLPGFSCKVSELFE